MERMRNGAGSDYRSLARSLATRDGACASLHISSFLALLGGSAVDTDTPPWVPPLGVQGRARFGEERLLCDRPRTLVHVPAQERADPGMHNEKRM